MTNAEKWQECMENDNKYMQILERLAAQRFPPNPEYVGFTETGHPIVRDLNQQRREDYIEQMLDTDKIAEPMIQSIP